MPAALSIAVLGLTVQVAAAHAREPRGVSLHLPPPVAEPTSLAASLATPSTSGSSLTVTEGTPVRATAALTATYPTTAHGRLTYRLFSDSSCTQEVTSSATHVEYGLIRPSRTVRLPAGSYYWQASYTGDAHHEASTTACGSTVQTVEPFIAHPCSHVTGEARDTNEGERARATFNLSTDLSSRERFFFHWPVRHRVRLLHLQAASCWVLMRRAVFQGTGTAVVDGAHGYLARFQIAVSHAGQVRVEVATWAGREFIDRVSARGSANETTVWEGLVPLVLGPDTFPPPEPS
ncbi:MAG TPA: hypothetical protein VHY83_13810 [Solirubrobacteraceae bacterium]|nr:hypothetical protein [Solirubrobacteraceae bacterium]